MKEAIRVVAALAVAMVAEGVAADEPKDFVLVATLSAVPTDEHHIGPLTGHECFSQSLQKLYDERIGSTRCVHIGRPKLDPLPYVTAEELD